MEIFAQRLKEIRISRGITQKEMADYLEMRENAYQNYEYNKREPNFKVLTKICRKLNISSDYLIGISNESREV